MKLTTTRLQCVALLPRWQKLLLSLFMPSMILLCYYGFITPHYQRKIALLQTDITQKLIQINQYQTELNTLPSADLLSIQQSDYILPFEDSLADVKLQHLLVAHHFIPETWENEHNTAYKLTFTLPYSHFLTLLSHLSRTDFSLTLLNVIPTKTRLLSIQIHLIKLSDAIFQQEASS